MYYFAASMSHTLYLVPVPLSEDVDKLYHFQFPLLNHIRVFITENVREARRNLRRIGFTKDFDDCVFYEWDKHNEANNAIEVWLQHCRQEDVALLSDAGCPAVADPGAAVVAMAHQLKINVMPLIGPSSILLALMGSGLNGQSFAFNGYLPVESKERKEKLKQLEQRSYTEQQTQLFIETPYRNKALLQDIMNTLHPSTKLCVAINLTATNQSIISDSIQGWKKRKLPEGKMPAVFLILREK